MKGTAIITKFLGPSNTRGARVKATMPSGKSVTISWDHAKDSDGNHAAAAAAALQKHQLDGFYNDHGPWVRCIREIYGYKSGYVVIVDKVSKDRAPKY